jgi:hypothetical protein
VWRRGILSVGLFGGGKGPCKPPFGHVTQAAWLYAFFQGTGVESLGQVGTGPWVPRKMKKISAQTKPPFQVLLQP